VRNGVQKPAAGYTLGFGASPSEVPNCVGRAGFLTRGSSYSLRLPDGSNCADMVPAVSLLSSVAYRAAFITAYSCGAVRGLHPLPYYLRKSTQSLIVFYYG